MPGFRSLHNRKLEEPLLHNERRNYQKSAAIIEPLATYLMFAISCINILSELSYNRNRRSVKSICIHHRNQSLF